MRTGLLLLFMSAIACGGPERQRQPAPAAPAATDARVEQGRTLVRQYGCHACHTIPGIEGATGAIGPSLAGLASRPTISSGTVQNTPANLAQYIQTPSSLDPQSTMPPVAVTDPEAEAIVAFLLTIK